MTTSRPDPAPSGPSAVGVQVTDTHLVVELSDGRALRVPLEHYPRLRHGTPEERSRWRLIAHGEGIHWTELDEDVSVEGLLAGHVSGESPRSLQWWLDARGQRGAA